MARTIAKDHDQKRAHILRAAAMVFATQGFDRASMNLLARECGISKANIYHYYDGKMAILFDILDSYLKALRNRVLAVEITCHSPAQTLQVIITEILLAYQGADHEHQVQISAMSALPHAQQEQLRGYQRDLVRFVENAIHANAPEVFDANAGKLRATTMSVFGMLNWYYMWNSGAGSQARDDYAQMVCHLTLHGVKGL
ncbi:MAG: TetR/AcrR family transcriptional regulator [Rhodobacteraceae bacterium]|nr:TetR/AcrR family transcriptional regulator [Paracoccaceae bacterium]